MRPISVLGKEEGGGIDTSQIKTN